MLPPPSLPLSKQILRSCRTSRLSLTRSLSLPPTTLSPPLPVAQARRCWGSAATASMAVGHAAAYAGLTSDAYQPAVGERVAVVVCGANTNTTTPC